MSFQFLPYQVCHESAVRAFNERLRIGGSAFQFPESATPPFPDREGATIRQRFYLVLEEQEVRAACKVQLQEFQIGEEHFEVANYQLPLSEGVVTPKYAPLGVFLLRSILKSYPLLYCLGMGGLDKPLPLLLKSMRWTLLELPFFFYVLRGNPFAKNLRFGDPRLRTPLRILGSLGLAHPLLSLGQSLRAPRKEGSSSLMFTEQSTFSPWADRIWAAQREHFPALALRSADVLDALIPRDDKASIRLEFPKEQASLLLRLSKLQDHSYFGDMTLGSIIDGIASPADMPSLIRTGTALLCERGADLVLSNQSHRAWRKGFSDAGFLSGPSNFALGLSPKLTEKFSEAKISLDELHFTRLDGDGPIHL